MTHNKNDLIAATEVIAALVSTYETQKEKISAYAARCQNILKQLNQVKTQKGFGAVVDEVIQMQKELKSFLGEGYQKIGGAAHRRLSQEVTRRGIEFFPTLIDFGNDSAEAILATKERLSRDKLSILPQHNREEALKFINAIKRLEAAAGLVDREINAIKEQLKNPLSLDEINQLDESMTKMSERLKNTVTNSFHYPHDEDVATAIVIYLDDNPHVKRILQAFDCEERLADSFLDARARQSIR